MKILSIWFWESLENLPLVFGFVGAAQLWPTQPFPGVICLLLGLGLGVSVTYFIEARLHPGTYQPRWKTSLFNFLLFSALAFPFLFYFRLESPWLTWKTDLVAGAGVGLLLTLGQSTVWQGSRARMALHGLAMLAACPLLLLGLRFIILLENTPLALGLTLALTLFASLVIALIDYQEMYRSKK